MIKRFWNWLKSFFETPEYFTRQIPMSELEFGNMKDFFTTKDNVEVEIYRTLNENIFEVWKMISATTENGESVSAVELVGKYDKLNEIFYYTSGFDSLFEKYNRTKND